MDADNRGGARTATEHLITRGRRRIATITGRLDEGAGTARYKGYQEALALAGLEAHRVVSGDFSGEGGGQAMRELLETWPDLDAVFIASDQMAMGALRVLRAAGRTVPGDVAVVGFNDISSARHTEPADHDQPADPRPRPGDGPDAAGPDRGGGAEPADPADHARGPGLQLRGAGLAGGCATRR